MLGRRIYVFLKGIRTKCKANISGFDAISILWQSLRNASLNPSLEIRPVFNLRNNEIHWGVIMKEKGALKEIIPIYLKRSYNIYEEQNIN